MLVVVTGGSGSGKSAFAEETILSLGEARRIYIATMQAFDEESHRRIRRHRHMRAGKGFETIERYTELDELLIPRTAWFFWSACPIWLQMRCSGKTASTRRWQKRSQKE